MGVIAGFPKNENYFARFLNFDGNLNFLTIAKHKIQKKSEKSPASNGEIKLILKIY